MRLSKSIVVAAAVLTTAIWSVVANGQTTKTEAQCNDPKLLDKLPPLPGGCQRERINATGGMRPTTGLALGSAEKEWRREVVTKYGERFLNLQYAVCQKTECVPAAISGLKRCSVSAIPCAVKATFVGGASIAVAGLTADETKEIQKLLKVKADGNFGPASVAALQKWQRSQKPPLKDDGEPTKAILEQLKKK